ncbi:hypothetical protein ACWGDX_27940 [Streptomyces sp. NPDC055025]
MPEEFADLGDGVTGGVTGIAQSAGTQPGRVHETAVRYVAALYPEGAARRPRWPSGS